MIRSLKPLLLLLIITVSFVSCGVHIDSVTPWDDPPPGQEMTEIKVPTSSSLKKFINEFKSGEGPQNYYFKTKTLTVTDSSYSIRLHQYEESKDFVLTNRDNSEVVGTWKVEQVPQQDTQYFTLTKPDYEVLTLLPQSSTKMDLYRGTYEQMNGETDPKLEKLRAKKTYAAPINKLQCKSKLVVVAKKIIPLLKKGTDTTSAEVCKLDIYKKGVELLRPLTERSACNTTAKAINEDAQACDQ
ncbi:MAG: hypothetical protein ISR65_06885 [Bacteriovoracaceae bacterium]|nr:hypothetical protein [Bacteriovoracaceae bacterium]